ncbi:MAG: AraC family transcriptional regulator [bacterium]|nr:AraC family transcriptional regulator [bacterium]
MNNLQLVEKVLYYIDDHIADGVEFEDLAKHFGYSPFHFHRIFSAVTGQTLMEYIRRRRLTMAHQKLCKTRENVAEICYSVGFNSIQTFNRAFKESFGMSPVQARESKAFVTYRDVPTVVAGYLKKVELEGVYAIEPKFTVKDGFTIAGYRKHTKDGLHVIGESWHELKQHWDDIQRKNKKVMYGFEDYSEDYRAALPAFYYMAAVEVDREAALPGGMVKKVIPKAEYAVFTVNGNNANGEIGQAFQYIYYVWLPNSEYCIDGRISADFEYYDERWDCQTGTAQMDIYIPVRKMEG